MTSTQEPAHHLGIRRITLKKRQVDVVGHLKRVPDHLAEDIHQDPWPLLFPEGPTRH
jgi:hypothetical protein